MTSYETSAAYVQELLQLLSLRLQLAFRVRSASAREDSTLVGGRMGLGLREDVAGHENAASLDATREELEACEEAIIYKRSASRGEYEKAGRPMLRADLQAFSELAGGSSTS